MSIRYMNKSNLKMYAGTRDLFRIFDVALAQRFTTNGAKISSKNWKILLKLGQKGTFYFLHTTIIKSLAITQLVYLFFLSFSLVNTLNK